MPLLCDGCGGHGCYGVDENDQRTRVSVVYSVIVLKLDALACSMRNCSTSACGICRSELMMERLSGDRINKWTVNRERASEPKRSTMLSSGVSWT